MHDLPLKCALVTPERIVAEQQAERVVLPAFDGEIAVLKRHVPTVARLGAGEVRIVRPDGTDRYFIDGGFAQITNDVVTVLSPRVRKVADLDASQLETELQEIMSQTASTPEAQKDRDARLYRTRVALRLAGGRSSLSSH